MPEPLIKYRSFNDKFLATELYQKLTPEEIFVNKILLIFLFQNQLTDGKFII